MKFVILYGPPAVGKLTTARELAKITGYKVFHNHLSVDIVKTLYDFGELKFWILVRKIREMFIKSAVEDGIDTIFTLVYDAGDDDELVKKYFSIVENNGGEVLLVQLTTTPDILKERVVGESRKKFQKMSHPESLERWLKQYKLFNLIPERQSLTIDNSNLSPQEVARKIVQHFDLPIIVE
jgi:tRNA uridine 5-carbamoylmethylation protein Kti12